MIYGTNRLYYPSGEVAVAQVVETADGYVVAITPFVCEIHSMVWYDTIFLCSKLYKKQLFASIIDLHTLLADDNVVSSPLYAYGVNFDGGCCLFEPLR
ncbi:MAG: hypothetical protein IJW68_00630 [Bacteroidaceae bacterium]|nr:hypothetical protein [Bacteroidaceae bacterium]